MEKNTSTNRLHSETQSPSREGNSVGKRLRTRESSIKNEIFHAISTSLEAEQWHSFGRRLGFETLELQDLEDHAKNSNLPRDEKFFRMLEKWQQRENPSEEEMVRKLKTALREIKRNDVETKIDEIYTRWSASGRNDVKTTIQEEVDDPVLLKKIQEVLKKVFKDLTLPTFVWLDNKKLPLDKLFVELAMKYEDNREEKKEKYINKEDVFLETEKGIPRRILVEAQPGYGKTTLVAKFLSDWAKEEKYLTNRFDLVFVIALRNYTGNLMDHLLQHCERVKTSEKNIMRVIESNKERVLLLLDGYDEIPSEVKEKIYPLIMGDEYPEMTVVVTCRVGFLKLETKSNTCYQGLDIQSLKDEFMWDKRVKIEGVSRNKRKEFLQKYLDVTDEKLEEQLSQKNLELNDLYECPLFLLLLAVLVLEKDIPQIKTKTELYKAIVNFVVNRGLKKLKGEIKYFDVFDLKTKSDEFDCRSLLINFGRLCLEKIKNRSLIFEKSELLKCSDGNGDEEDLIFKLGFLAKQVIFFNYEEKELYEPVHRSFLEFLAAFYLSLSDEMEREIQELVSTFKIWPEDDQLLYPFLGGLLHSDAFKMFNSFSAFKHLITIFTRFEYNVRKVFLEIPETEENLKSLENLAIGDWKWVIYKKSLHFWFDGLITNRSEEVFLNIPLNLDIINGVSDDIKVNTVRVSVDEEMKKENMIIEKTIHCQNLIIKLKAFNENITMIPKEMSKIKAEKVWLKIERNFFFTCFSTLAEDLCEIFHENFRMTVDEKLIERFPEELVEGIGRNVDQYLHRVLREKFQTKMRDKIGKDFDKYNLFDSDEKITAELDQCYGDETEQKLSEEICEKFGEKLKEISRDMLEDKLFEKFYKELNYLYKYIGQQCCRHFGRELGDLLNVSVCEILSKNSGEIEGELFSEWILKQMEGVLDKVVRDIVKLDEVVSDEDVEIDRKCKLLGQEICIQLEMKKTIVDTLSEKIFYLIAIETVEKLDEEMVQRIDKKLFFLIREYLVKSVKWLNEPELPFNIYHLSLSYVTGHVFTIVAPLIQDLIEKKKIVHGIKIQFSQKNINDSFIKTYNSFMEIVCNSHLKSIGVGSCFHDNPLPFPMTSSNNEKQMEFIGLSGSFKGINVDQIKTVSVDHFDCLRLRLEEENLLLPQLISTFTNMKKLSCDCDLINILGDCDSIAEWKQLETIEQLVIDIRNEEMIKKESFLKGIALFQNVRELGLLHFEVKESNIEFVARLPSLKKIHYYGRYFPNEFFKKLLDLKFEQGKRELRLDAVEIELIEKVNLSENAINDIELCFQKNIFHKFSIIDYWTNDFGNVFEHFISKRGFKVYCQWKESCCGNYDPDKVLRNQLTICCENVK